MQVQKTSLKKYIAIGIVAAYVISYALNALMEIFTRSNLYMVSSMVSLFAGSCIAGHVFFENHKRASSIEENARYSWYFLLWGILVPLAAILGVLFAFYYYHQGNNALLPIIELIDGLRTATGKALLLVALVGFMFTAFMALHYVVIRWSFSWYTKLQWKQKKEKVHDSMSP